MRRLIGLVREFCDRSQFLVVTHLPLDVSGKHLVDHFVHLVDGTLLVWPLGIDEYRVIGAVAGGPENQEPEPARIERQVLQAPLLTFRHVIVVNRVFEHPGCRALEDRQLRHIAGGHRLGRVRRRPLHRLDRGVRSSGRSVGRGPSQLGDTVRRPEAAIVHPPRRRHSSAASQLWPRVTPPLSVLCSLR